MGMIHGVNSCWRPPEADFSEITGVFGVLPGGQLLAIFLKVDRGIARRSHPNSGIPSHAHQARTWTSIGAMGDHFREEADLVL